MKFYIINLGCKVNAYESMVMSDLLTNASYIKGSIDDADAVGVAGSLACGDSLKIYLKIYLKT